MILSIESDWTVPKIYQSTVYFSFVLAICCTDLALKAKITEKSFSFLYSTRETGHKSFGCLSQISLDRSQGNQLIAFLSQLTKSSLPPTSVVNF